MVILKIGQVHHISGFLVGITTKRDRQIVDNNLKFFFTYTTELSDLLDECNAISYYHLPPFVPFVDVSSHLQCNAQIIGKYNVQWFCELFKSAFVYMHASYWIRSVDVIGWEVVISNAEMTRAGTLKRDVLSCDMQYAFPPNYILAFMFWYSLGLHV